MNDKKIDKIFKDAGLEDVAQTFNSAIEICTYDIPKHTFEYDGDYVVWQIYRQALLDAAEVAEYFDIERHDVEAEYLFRMLAARFRKMAEEE